MKKLLLTTFFVVTFFALTVVSASAAAVDTVKVGLRYGSTAMFSANLENAVGEGYELGYFEDDEFTSVAWTDETAVSMTAAGTIYLNSGSYASTGSGAHLGPWHVQLDGFLSFADAASTAASYTDAYPAWVNWNYVVRIGSYDSRTEAEDAASQLGGSAVQSSSTGVIVTVTKTTEVLFEFDCSGVVNFGVQPSAGRQEAVTWFKGYKYYGAFSYPRVTGGNLNVINVVDLEDYVKGVLGYEMGSGWPLAALEAQAVCARTFARTCTKHNSYGFDVCGSTDCQMYGGVNVSTTQTDLAVEETAGKCLYYNGALVQNAVYHSSNGGATEDGYYIWGTETGYLKGKVDPYEALTTIPNYNWTETYTADQLTWILQQKGYQVGTVKNVYVSEYTPMGNVYKVTFEHSGGTLTVKGNTAASIFYSSTYGKSAHSQRFTINGGTPTTSASTGGSVYVNNGTQLSGLDGVSVISGTGKVSQLTGNAFSVLTSSGTTKVTSSGGGTTTAAPTTSADGTFTLTGTGSGHNVGMSQYGAKAMAEQGYSYDEILEFYYTNITVR